MNTEYTRVIPRDLFNEAKLLKCIGHLCLLIHDGKALNSMEFQHDDEPFIIGLFDEGQLGISNIKFSIGDTFLDLRTQYNSKNNYPLLCVTDNYEEHIVFDDNGVYTSDFIEYCKILK